MGLTLSAAALVIVSFLTLDAKLTPELLPQAQPVEKGGYIKWAEFDVPDSAMKKAMKLDIESCEEPLHLDWLEMLGYLGAKYGGEWKRYKAKDMDALVQRLRGGESMSALTADMKYYDYYHEVYQTVLGEFVGYYDMERESDVLPGETFVETQYGLKVFSPIASGYSYSHYDDFGTSRSYGYSRPHLGNDLVGSIGTPIVAVEGGTIEHMGWNQYGGWRIGILSFDKKRYYYYAHLRQKHPYHLGLEEGMAVNAGDVIGYLGMTGYSTKEGANNMTVPHLHLGMQLIFDDSQIEGNGEIWIDMYDIVSFLSQKKSKTVKDEATKDYNRIYQIYDPDYQDYITAEEGGASPPGESEAHS
ncbi:M23 family metallopeptidase [Oscillospiraceae bacterium NSJ-54]|uniref:M23 family metallopeptidase n=2 Tax=Zongyangia hominis TaxID=2763677 RepID=A0A926ECD1_9FIRM|nr:M23 family metallopeptidase [Zongyangia hominis]